MKKVILFSLLIAITANVCAQNTLNIVPRPQVVEMKSGNFLFDKKVSVQFLQSDLNALADYMINQLSDRFGIKISKDKKSSKNIILSVDKKMSTLGNEGYTLQVGAEEVKITANNPRGIFYGIQSFLQTIPYEGKKEIPCLLIQDKPQFAWRGMMLDVSRHFFTVKQVKEFLDILATYKMNVFHWHLTDNQGWRLEIKKYPKLTSVGAWRMEKPGAVFFQKDSTLKEKEKRYGGFYTQKEAREIVAYAKDRNITVIPEIDIPGHSEAALAAYPQFSCRQQPQIVTNAYGSPPGASDNYCPANDSTFTFLENILTEVMDIFPSKYIHIGGDEVDKTEWKNDPKCQALIKEKNLKDEEGLQSYFIHRIAEFLEHHGKTIIGWDETLQGGLAPNAVVQSWRGIKGGITAAQLHHDVIMSPSNPLYFNRYQGDPKTEPLAAKWSINTLQKVFEYNPIPIELNSADGKYILGAEGAIWTEFFKTNDYLQYMLLPRLLALSEITWSGSENKSWQDFLKKMPYQFKLFEKEKWSYDSKDLEYEVKK
ncbi:MAG: beta-N-acetylhexosaminidase [Ginsengibacter sp.]